MLLLSVKAVCVSVCYHQVEDERGVHSHTFQQQLLVCAGLLLLVSQGVDVFVATPVWRQQL